MERVYTTIDRSCWETPPGTWDAEPDKVQWTDAATGLPCLAKRHPSAGHWCGYAGVAEPHPFFGKGYSERVSECSDEDCYEHTPEGLLSVHGGITYSDACQEGPEDTSICHIPEAGQPDHVWWFGFDCAHAGDLSPAYAFKFGGLHMQEDEYRSLDYVRSECADLARQLVEHAGG